MKKGITFLSVMVAVVALAIIATTVIIAVPNVIQNYKLRAFATELMTVQTKIDALNGNYSEYITNDIIVDISDLTDKSMFEGVIENNKVVVQQLNLEALGFYKTAHGNGKTTKDMYCVCPGNNVVYYLEGYETADAKYYALNSSLINMVSNKEDLTNNVGENVVFIPSTYVKTREGIKVTVKVPAVATGVSVTASGSISPLISNATSVGNYIEYTVNTASSKGNYTITVSYMLNGENKTASYIVDEYMGVYGILYSDGELRINNDGKIDKYKIAAGNTVVMESGDVTNVWGYNGWVDYRTQIITVTFENEVAPKMPNYWFQGCSNLVAVNNAHFLNLSSTTGLSCMFLGCSKLESIDVSQWDTSKILDMSYLFTNCNKVKEFDVSEWDTSSVTTMEALFTGCNSLIKLDVSQWDTKNVKSMARLFENVWSITELDVSKWDTSNATNMAAMFRMVEKVSYIDVSNFNTSAVTKMNQMFYGCAGLKILDLSNFNTARVLDMAQMFSGCSSLESINVSSFDTSAVENMTRMFMGCSALEEIDISNFKSTNLKEVGEMFAYCELLKSVDASKVAESNITSLSSMFLMCNDLETVILTNFKAELVTDTHMMFYPLKNLKFIDLRSASFTQVSASNQMFAYFSNELTIVVKDDENKEIMQMFAEYHAGETISNVTILTAKEYEAML